MDALEQALTADIGDTGGDRSIAYEGADAPPDRGDDGRFVAAEPEPSWGLESLENGMGYLRQDPTDTRISADDDALLRRMGEIYENFGDTEDAAVDLTIPMVATDSAGTKLADHMAISEEAAADQLIAAESEVAEYIEGNAVFEEFAKIDQARADAAKELTDEQLKSMDLRRSDIETNAKAWDDPQQAAQQPEQPASQSQEPPIEGLDPAAAKALNENPQLRGFLEAQAIKGYEADQQLGRYIQAQAQGVVQQLNALLGADIGQLPTLEARQAAFARLQQVDPGRYAQAVAVLKDAERLEWAAGQVQQNNREAEQARMAEHMRTWGRQEDAKVKVSQADGQAVREWAEETFGSVDAYAQLLATNPAYRSAEAQQTVIDAARWRAAQKAGKAVPVRTPPTVQRPGTSNARSAREVSEAQLSARLDRSGSQEDAFQLYLARGGR